MPFQSCSAIVLLVSWLVPALRPEGEWVIEVVGLEEVGLEGVVQDGSLANGQVPDHDVVLRSSIEEKGSGSS